jgi:hypothetical protein
MMTLIFFGRIDHTGYLNDIQEISIIIKIIKISVDFLLAGLIIPVI